MSEPSQELLSSVQEIAQACAGDQSISAQRDALLRCWQLASDGALQKMPPEALDQLRAQLKKLQSAARADAQAGDEIWGILGGLQNQAQAAAGQRPEVGGDEEESAEEAEA